MSSEETKRTFIAIRLPGEVRKNLYNLSRNYDWKYFKRVSPENIHLTLKFLGNTGVEYFPGIHKSLRQIAKKASGFKLNITSVGAFPTPKRARVFWAGLQKTPSELKQVYSRIEREMVKMGFKQEKRGFSPHITLGRFKKYRDIRPEVAEINQKIDKPIGMVKVKEICHIESILKRTGPEYIDIETFTLKGGETP